MHDSRQRRTVARGIDAKALVRNVILLVAAVAVAVVLIPVDDSEDAPGGAVQTVVQPAH
ncbi:hypothetical protein GCM10028820_12680 [Tessaracoccus terricola]